MVELATYQQLDSLDQNFFENVKDVLTSDPLLFSQGNYFARFTLDVSGVTKPVIREQDPDTIWKKRLKASEALGVLFLPVVELAHGSRHLQGISTLLCDADTMLVQTGKSQRGIDASRWHVDYVHDYETWEELVATEGEELTTEVAIGMSDVNIHSGYNISKEAHRAGIHNMEEQVNAGIARQELRIVRPTSRALVVCSGELVHRSPINYTGSPIDRTFIRIMPADAVQPTTAA